MGEYIKMSDTELLEHCGADASKWAAAFCRIKEEQGWSAGDIDEALMIGWFANAIECSSQVRASATSARIAALEGALDGMVLVCGRSGDAFYDFEEQAEVFYQETGYMRPGKDVPMEMARDDEDERRAKYSAWVKTKLDAGRAALASTEAMKGE